MKLWSTPWHRRPEARPRTRTGGALACAALVSLLATGCVTRGTHEEIVGDLESQVRSLESENQDLKRSNRSLDEERVRLIDEMEDLRQERETLTRDIAKLSKTKELLSEHLRKREEQVEELSKTTATYRKLVTDLESEVSAGQITIEQLRDGIRLNLPQDILFRSGAAQLEGTGVAVLRKVSDRLKKIDHTVEVQGHTDDVPLSAALAKRYGTNWELAAARASSVVRLFEDAGIDPRRLTAVSHGEYAPVASNDTPEGRARNRRIEIYLIPEGSAAAAPAEASGEDDSPAS